MGTNRNHDSLAGALFGDTRRALLALLFTYPDEAHYVREMSRAVGTGRGAVQRELKSLERAGIVTRSLHARRVYYQANRDYPVFPELARLFRKLAEHP